MVHVQVAYCHTSLGTQIVFERIGEYVYVDQELRVCDLDWGQKDVFNFFSPSLKKSETIKSCVLNFAKLQFLNDRIQKNPFVTWQFSKILVLVNFIIQELN